MLSFMTTVFGWDASDYDWLRGPMDLGAARSAGVQFFTHKATEGTSGVHKHTGEALVRASNAGIPVLGAYHVVRSGSVAAQVSHFLAYLDAQAPWWRDWPDWMLQVDLEKWPYDSVSAATGLDFTHQLAAAVPARMPIVYASRGQYGNELAGLSAAVPLWNAAYPSSNPGSLQGLYARAGGDGGTGWTSYSGRTPTVWQFTSNATIGSQTRCDGNAFRGTLDQLKATLRGPAAASAATAEDFLMALDEQQQKDMYEWLAGLMDEEANPPTRSRFNWRAPKLAVMHDTVDRIAAMLASPPPPATLDVPTLVAALQAAGIGQVDVGKLATALAAALPSHITLTGTITS